MQHDGDRIRQPQACHPNVDVPARHAWAWSVVRVPSLVLHDDACVRHPYHPNGGAAARHVWVWYVVRAPSPLHDVCVRRPCPQARGCHLTVCRVLLLLENSS